MTQIRQHPILDIPKSQETSFEFEGRRIKGQCGFTIAAALHQAGYPVHSHSLTGRLRSLECGIGKCGACEMLVDGKIKRICMTRVDDVKTVSRINEGALSHTTSFTEHREPLPVYRTRVAIIGAGPAGLAAREKLLEHKIDCLVVDSNDSIGGQFLMQTHKFFFFEKQRQFGGFRGFEIAHKLAGPDHDGIFLNTTVWDIFDDRRLAVKENSTGRIFHIQADYLIVATGAVPFLPAFENDDLPGVYTAAVIQKMMNRELTLLGKNVLTVGAGNIGYLTSYQLIQAGAHVAAIIEAQDAPGGFPVQANRLTRLGVPLLTSHMLLRAIPNKAGDGVAGAIVAKCENFVPQPGSEKLISGIDTINICTGLVPDNALLLKGRELFGRRCFGVGDAQRIGEGTTAVLSGQQAACEILEELHKGNRIELLQITKGWIESQQHPLPILKEPILPSSERRKKPFVVLDCLHGFACNPCQFACRFGAISKTSPSDAVRIDHDKCTGCMQCIVHCPGLAIFGFNLLTKEVFLPIEFAVDEGAQVALVANDGQEICKGLVRKVVPHENKTTLVRVYAPSAQDNELLRIRGLRQTATPTLQMEPASDDKEFLFVCHCEDVDLESVLQAVGERNSITVDEVKHITHLGMGPCRGKRCLLRLRQLLASRGIALLGEATPRAPLSNQILLGDVRSAALHKEHVIVSLKKSVRVSVLVAGGGIAGSALFRYLAEAGLQPVLINSGFGSSWRNIAAGRPAFSVPELSEIARENASIFAKLDQAWAIDYAPISYVTFAHDEATLASLEASMTWQNAKFLGPHEFNREVSPYFQGTKKRYLGALKSFDCWQASPGKTIHALRMIGEQNGGQIFESHEVIDVSHSSEGYRVVVRGPEGYTEFSADHFVNALGASGEKFARKLGLDVSLFPVRHQAFITRRLPMLGISGRPLDMLIDRCTEHGFCAVYGQQLKTTGQIIACASPHVEHSETARNLKANTHEFLQIVSEVFLDWLPILADSGFQAVWSGYYVEPRMFIDPKAGLFLGMKGHGFMLSQHLARLYVDALRGRTVPSYFDRLACSGDGLHERIFK